MSTTWGRLAGSTGSFAMEVRLIDDPEPVASVDPDESASWGAMRLWANGRNLTSHREADEVVTSLHWYVLPICEWLVENWDAALHEERLPGPDVIDGVSGIERLAQKRLISEDREDELDAEVRTWWHRHNLAVGALGSVLPPTIVRRWGDRIEISMSGRRPAGAPDHVGFGGPVVERVGAGVAAAALAEMLKAVSHELVRRRPGSERLAELRRAVDALDAPERETRRLVLLGAPIEVAENLVETSSHSGPVIQTAPGVVLLFGSLAPQVEAPDVDAITRFVGTLREGTVELDRLTLPQADVLVGSPAGPMGSALGDDAWDVLADAGSTPVEVENILAGLGVVIDDIVLTDPSVRSICMLSGGGAAVAINPSFAHGEAPAVRRFSLAHELCHLLFDRERAVSLAIASGPWAPRDLEQRANAFAAAFLMPSSLVAALVADADAQEPAALARLVADELNVPYTSAIDRLRNLGVLTHDQADQLKNRS